MKEIENFINVIESNCGCILYFFLTEGIDQLDMRDCNISQFDNALHFKDYYELNCVARDYSQAVTLLKYLNQTSGINAVKSFLKEILNNYEAFNRLGDDKDSNYQIRVAFLSSENCNKYVFINSDLKSILICWLKDIISQSFSDLDLF